MNPMSNTRLLYLSFYVQSGMTRSANHLKLRISHFLGTRRLLATLLRLPQIFATSVGNFSDFAKLFSKYMVKYFRNHKIALQQCIFIGILHYFSALFVSVKVVAFNGFRKFIFYGFLLFVVIPMTLFMKQKVLATKSV